MKKISLFENHAKSGEDCDKFSKSVSYETLVGGTPTAGRDYKQTQSLSKGSAKTPLTAVGTLTSQLCCSAKVVEKSLYRHSEPQAKNPEKTKTVIPDLIGHLSRIKKEINVMPILPAGKIQGIFELNKIIGRSLEFFAHAKNRDDFSFSTPTALGVQRHSEPQAKNQEKTKTVIPDLIGYLSRIKNEVAEILGSRLPSCPRMTGKALSFLARCCAFVRQGILEFGVGDATKRVASLRGAVSTATW